jgi:hypothetical protein
MEQPTQPNQQWMFDYALKQMRDGTSSSDVSRYLIDQGADPEIAVSIVQQVRSQLRQEIEQFRQQEVNRIYDYAASLLADGYADEQVVQRLVEHVALTNQQAWRVIDNLEEMRTRAEQEEQAWRAEVNRIYKYAISLHESGSTDAEIHELLLQEGLNPESAATVVNNLAGMRVRAKEEENAQQEEIARIYQYAADLMKAGHSDEQVKQQLIVDKGLTEETATIVTAHLSRVHLEAERKASIEQMLQGGGIAIIGLLITGITYWLASGGGIYVVATGAIFVGGLRFLMGLVQYASTIGGRRTLGSDFRSSSDS